MIFCRSSSIETIPGAEMTCIPSVACRPSKRKPLLRAACLGFLCLGLGVISRAAPVHKNKDLHIYFVDVEGGQATLFVTPAGQSLLIDTGWPGNDDRDANRIVAAARKAGLSKIDYVLITHFHQDHVGGSLTIGRAHSDWDIYRPRRKSRDRQRRNGKRLSGLPGGAGDGKV
jgi:glyoxylase-like metal-dependent hydrolase (beta-lactamase superfamily II)